MEVHRSLFQNREVLYCRDLLDGEIGNHEMPDPYFVDRYNSLAEMPESLYKRITGLYTEKIIGLDIRKRFDKGAHLWCLRNDKEEIGYIWSLEGRTMKPYYFPLMPRDVYFLDGLIFPEYRGQGQFFYLLDHIVKYYRSLSFHRIYFKIQEWNSSSMKSVAKNGFVRIGIGKIRNRRGKSKVTWWLQDANEQ